MFSSNLIKNYIKIPCSIHTRDLKDLYKKKFFSTFILYNNDSYQFKYSVQEKYFNSTHVLRNLSTIKLEQPSITISNKDHCSGCGAKFQIEDSLKPGYLIKPSFTTNSNQNSKISSSLDSSQQDKSISSLTNQKSINNVKKMSKQEIENALSKLPEDLKRLMYPFEDTQKETTVSNPTLKEQEEEERIFCQRCYNLKYHNKITSTTWQETLISDQTFLKFLQKKKNSIILTIIDIFDFPGSLIKNLDNLIGKHHKNILIANKFDLLSKGNNYIIDNDRIKNWLKNYCSIYGLNNIYDIFICSAKKNWMIKELCYEISKIRNYDDDIYLIGNTNVGKSELINSFLRINVYNGRKYKVTSSHIPGTTINMLGLPLDIFGNTFGRNVKGMLFNNNQEDGRYLFDTPGIVDENQLFHFLDQEELKMIIPHKSIRPLTYIIKPGKSLLFGGLGRIDYKKGMNPIRLTVFSQLDSHITSIERANEFYEQLSSCEKDHFLKPPIGSIERLKKFPKIIKSISDLKVVSSEELYKYTKKISILDVVWSGIGWCSVGGVKIGESAVFDVWSPDGRGVYIRNMPLLPYEFRGKLEKIK